MEFFANPAFGGSVPTGVFARELVSVDIRVGESGASLNHLNESTVAACTPSTPTLWALANAYSARSGVHQPRSWTGPFLRLTSVPPPRRAFGCDRNNSGRSHKFPGVSRRVIDIASLLTLVVGGIDLLKVDIDGSNYGSINGPVFSNVAKAISIACTELQHRSPEVGIARIVRPISLHATRGFVRVRRKIEINEQLTFGSSRVPD